MRKSLIVFLVFFYGWLPAQSLNLDSLEQSLATSPRDTNRAITLYKLCFAFNRTDTAKAWKYGKEALQLSMQLNFQKGIGAAYNNLGMLYELSGDDVKALKSYTLALDAKEKTGDLKSQASTLNNIGIIYKKQEHYARALEFYSRAASINRQSGNEGFLMANYYNMANCYKALDRFDSAFYYYNLATEFSIRNKAYKTQTEVLNAIGNYYADQGEHQTALKYFDSSYAIKVRYEIVSDDRTYYEGKARSFVKLGMLDSAEVYALKGWENKKDTKDWAAIKAISEILVLYYDARYEQTKNEEYAHLAREFLNIAIESRDSLHSFEKLNSIFDLATEDMVRQKNAEIEAVQREKELESLKATNEKQFKNFSIALAVVAVAVLVILFRRYRRNQALTAQLAEQKAQIESKSREIIDSITYAKRLQEAILPQPGFLKQFYRDSFVLYLPKDIVAGDFYWVETAADRIYIAAADCTGHGVPGAMVSVVCANALERSVHEFALKDPSDILNKTRELVIQTFAKSAEMVNDGMDISLLSLSLTDPLKNAQWSGANNPLWIVRNGELIELKGDKQPVGHFAAATPFSQQNTALQHGDWIYLFTDGYADQFGGPKGKKFKYSALKKKLIEISGWNSDEQVCELESTLKKWKGDLEQVDDICIIGLRVT